jgi:hypothetical protein
VKIVMQPTELTYAVFEANQVLTSDHLNDDFNYLDEQERLTRANLSGIGIVCGLEVSVTGDASHMTVIISKGCGVTSEGYLIVLDDGGFTADRCKEYTAPADVPYPPFLRSSGQESTNQYPLYELLDGSRDEYANGLIITQELINNPVVLLFVELDKGNLKNCSPGSCDDKGLEVNVTVRKLLIAAEDLMAINNAIAAQLASDGSKGDFFPNLDQRLKLVDLSMPRLDTPGPTMKDAQTIFMAYKKVLTPAFFKKIEVALEKAWSAFQPILSDIAPADPFANLLAKMAERYIKLTLDRKVVFSQYYYDFLDDIILAYDEFRWKAVDLMAMCAPPAGLHPRHLMLGELVPSQGTIRSRFRHYFRPSPATTGHSHLKKEVLSLFARLMLMVRCFDELIAPSANMTVTQNVRVTPSRIGKETLSERAIPYYYAVTKGTLALYERWNYYKTRIGRATQNLSYNAPAYGQDDFVLNPLNYDLEPFNFFRIEGHIGLSWRQVLEDLQKKIQRFRLPFDVVVLNAANLTVQSNPWLNRCISNDLQVIYDAWVKEAQCLYKTKMRYFTNLNIAAAYTRNVALRPRAADVVNTGKILAPVNTFVSPATRSGISIIGSVVNDAGTLGNMFLNVLNQQNIKTAQDIRINLENNLRNITEVSNMAGKDYDLVFGNRLDLVTAMYDYTSALPDDATTIDTATIDQKFTALQDVVGKYRDQLVAYVPPARNSFITQSQRDELLQQLSQLLDNCLEERLKSLQTELVSRRQQMEQMIYFSRFASNHPELQHKAGVTAGGTFVLVFQETQAATVSTGLLPVVGAVTNASPAEQPVVTINQQILAEAFTKMGTTLTQDVLKKISNVIPQAAINQQTFRVPEGVVIADFYIPTRCCSDCPPVQFVLPPAKDMEIQLQGTGKPTPDLIIMPQSGTGPYAYSVNGGEFQPLPESRQVSFASGTYLLVLRDKDGIESPTHSVTVPPPLALGPATPTTNKQITFKIAGGTPPYQADSGAIAGDTYTSGTFSSDGLVVKVTDSVGCAVVSAKLKL